MLLLPSSSYFFFFTVREWNDRQTVDGSKWIKLKTSFVRKHNIILNEWVNIFVAILPKEKYSPPNWAKFRANLLAEYWTHFNAYIESFNPFAVNFADLQREGYKFSSLLGSVGELSGVKI